MVDTAVDGVILIDGEMRVKFASPNAVSLLHRLGIRTVADLAGSDRVEAEPIREIRVAANSADTFPNIAKAALKNKPAATLMKA